MIVADDHQIALPMAGFRPIRRGERPVVDAEHWLLETASPTLLSLVRSAVIPTAA